jgi:cytochrome P450
MSAGATAVEELDVPELDDLDPALRGPAFDARMAELATETWIARARLGMMVIDRESGEFFLRSKQTSFPGKALAELFDMKEGALGEEVARNILHLDGDDHRRLRNLVNPAFTPRAVERYRSAMRGYLGELLDAVAGEGRCDLVAAVAKPYPSMVIATVMGAPVADAGRLWHWSNLIQRQFGTSLFEEREAIEQAVVEFYAYCDELLARRRASPGDDLISTLIAAEQDGDRLSDVELVNLVLNVLIGGVDTTQSQLAHAVRLFAGHPEQWELLGADPSLAAAAVDEVLRFEPITPFTARIALEDVEYRDVTFPEGTVVLVSAFNGNREPGAYDDPDRFDITADRGAAKPLTFGAGIHYCLGANLARAELQEALVQLSARWTELALDGEPAYGTIDGIYGLDVLPVQFRNR